MRDGLRADRARVRHDYRNIDEKVEQDIEDGHKEDETLHGRVVGRYQRIDGIRADPGPAEYLLGQHIGAEQEGKYHPNGR